MTAALLTVAGLVLGGALRAALRPHAYRTADEVGLPRRRRTWLPPATALTWGAAGHAWWPAEPAYLVFVLVLSVPLLVLTAIDLDVQRLPDRITLPLLAATAVAVLPVTLLVGRTAGLAEVLTCGAVALVTYAVLLAVPGSGMGGGDVKLAPTIGLMTGTLTWPLALLSGLVTFAVGGLFGVGLMVAGRARGTLMPFGPFMVLGALTVTTLLPAMSRL